jgi:hypothetical protein
MHYSPTWAAKNNCLAAKSKNTGLRFSVIKRAKHVPVHHRCRGSPPRRQPKLKYMEDTEKDYYAILCVLPSIDDMALAVVYRALLKKYHPDVFGGSKAEAERRTREIVKAYEVLGNPEKRKVYDSARKTNG